MFFKINVGSTPLTFPWAFRSFCSAVVWNGSHTVVHQHILAAYLMATTVRLVSRKTAATLEWPKVGPSSGFWRSLDGLRHFGPGKKHAYKALSWLATIFYCCSEWVLNGFCFLFSTWTLSKFFLMSFNSSYLRCSGGSKLLPDWRVFSFICWRPT